MAAWIFLKTASQEQRRMHPIAAQGRRADGARQIAVYLQYAAMTKDAAQRSIRASKEQLILISS